MPSSQIKAVVFDYGGVLINPITDHISHVAARHGVTMEDLLYVLMGPRETSTADHPWHVAERGHALVADMAANIGPWAAEKGITLAGDEYDAVLGGTFVVREAVVAAVAALHDAGFVTALLTNSFKEYRPVIEAAVDMSVFDHVIDSSEVGCRKPEPRSMRSPPPAWAWSRARCSTWTTSSPTSRVRDRRAGTRCTSPRGRGAGRGHRRNRDHARLTRSWRRRPSCTPFDVLDRPVRRCVGHRSRVRVTIHGHQ